MCIKKLSSYEVLPKTKSTVIFNLNKIKIVFNSILYLQITISKTFPDLEITLLKFLHISRFSNTMGILVLIERTN